MDAEWVADGVGRRHVAGSVAQLALTVAVAAGAVWAAVSLADQGDSSASLAVRPAATAPAPVTHEMVVSGVTPESAYFFIVGSEEARSALTSNLEAEAAVRAAVGQPPRVSWVGIASTGAEAEAITEAVNQDAANRALGPASAIEVVNLR